MMTTAYDAPTLDLDGLRDCSGHHNGTSYRLANALEAFVATLDPHDAEWVAAAVSFYLRSEEGHLLCEECGGVEFERCRTCDPNCDDHPNEKLICPRCDPPEPGPATCAECGEDISAPVCEECQAHMDDNTD